jgi:hypothetical protein
MKRLGVLLLAALLLLPAGAGQSARAAEEETPLRVLRAMEVMQGNEAGDLMLDKQVTRAEFVKMVLAASIYKDTAGASGGISPFPDVRYTHWAAGYIRTGVNLQIINGYLDGTFRPDATVKLEEAVNILLKMLEYTVADLSGAFPSAQMALYDALELNENMTAVRGQSLNRRQCVQLLYNFLNAATKSGAVYCTRLGYGLDAAGKIDVAQVITKAMDGPIVVQDGAWASQLPFPVSQAVSNTDIPVSGVKKNDVVYYSKSLKALWIYREQKTGIYNAAVPSEGTPVSVVLDGNTYAIGNADAAYALSSLGAFQTGDCITLLLGRDDLVEGVIPADLDDPDTDVKFPDLVGQTLEGPLVAEGNWTSKLEFAPDQGKIYQNGIAISPAQIGDYDILYYSNALRTIWVFHNRITGVLEGVSPTASAPQTVTVSGRTYAIESKEAAYDLSSLGSFRTGDTITLLLGKDGGAAGVIRPQAAGDSAMYGMVTATGKTQYSDGAGGIYTVETVTMLGTDGASYTYPLQKDQSYEAGDLIQVFIGSQGPAVSRLQKASLSGGVNEAGTRLGTWAFADEAEILDVDGGTAVCVTPWRLRNVVLKEANVLYYKRNSKGEITHLILKEVTGDMHQYGVLTSVQEVSAGMVAQGIYAYDVNGLPGVFQSSNAVYHVSKGPAQLKMERGGISGLQMLTAVRLDALGDFTAQGQDGTLYKLAQRAAVYEKRDGAYYYTNRTALENSGSSWALTGYYDKGESAGGCVRVIVAEAKS